MGGSSFLAFGFASKIPKNLVVEGQLPHCDPHVQAASHGEGTIWSKCDTVPAARNACATSVGIRAPFLDCEDPKMQRPGRIAGMERSDLDRDIVAGALVSEMVRDMARTSVQNDMRWTRAPQA
jgi:hypothetical protein